MSDRKPRLLADDLPDDFCGDNISYFGDISKEGWLLKKGHVVKNWKKRYFVLRLRTMFYYTKPNEKVEKGSIPLSHAELMISSDDTLGATVRTLSGVEFQLRFENATDQSEWTSAIRKAISNPAHGKMLLRAAADGHPTKIADILTEQPYDVLAVDKETNRNALHVAAMSGHEQIIKFLIQVGKRFGLDVNQADRSGWTPLSLAVRYERKQVLPVLLDAGAKIEKGAMFGNALMIAVDIGRLDIVEVLVAYGADVNSRVSDRIAPLHLAAENASLDLMEFLIGRGAEVDAKDRTGVTPLALACANERNLEFDIVKRAALCLVNHGADLASADVNGRKPIDRCRVAELRDALLET